MRIGGLQKVSLIDYPGQISSVVFTLGCNFRCHYCHNPELVYPQLWGPPIEEEEIWQFLENRRGKIDAVVVTGGEPLLHEDLPNFIAAVRGKGFLVKLDTNGAFPERLSPILRAGLVNYVAMDLKAPWPSYEKITGVKVDTGKIKESMGMILNSEIEYEFRITYAPPLITENDVLAIGQELRRARRLVIQKYRPKPGQSAALKSLHPPSDEELERIKGLLSEIISCVLVRK